ncbi:helix-turn-helix domain-containing protein [Streptacidiphilus jiangxiensis]|uniref:helix-turn-helix domain-containing protein n=1 Tax=Streptacidiphilus jiangxiensis TaxID=235985 RepID=UPI000944299B|nr:helix-turn-helix transcriptional regulator [Streptacidiphilus jiangxiensis]
MPFADYLKRLLQKSGKPTYRRLGHQIGYGRTTVSDAFQGRRLPSWDVTEPLVRALGGDVAEARRLWTESGGGGVAPPPPWLTDPVLPVPALVPGVGLARAAALAAADPGAALGEGWEVLRLCAAQLARTVGALPPSGAASVIDAFRRAEVERRLPPGACATADRLAQVREQHRDGSASVEVALQFVVFAYRLAGLVGGAGHSAPRPDREPADIVTLAVLAEDFGWRPDDEHLADYREFLATLVSALQEVAPADRALLTRLVQHGKTLRLGLGSPTYGMSGAELRQVVEVPPAELPTRLAALERQGLIAWQRHPQPAQEWVWTSKRDAYAVDGLRGFCAGRGLDLAVLIRDVRLDWLG